MKILKFTSGALLLLSFTTFAGSNLNQKTIDTYRKDTQASISLCGINYQTFLLKKRLSPNDVSTERADFDTCVDKAKSSAKTSYNKLSKSLKSKDAKSALKSYQIAYMTAIDGVAAGIGEAEIDYASRQQSLKEKMDQAWSSFELEE